MYAYYYTPEELGVVQFLPGQLYLEGFAETCDPIQADCFVIPTDLRVVTDDQIMNLPYLAGNEKAHVAYSVGERPDRALPADLIAFRVDYNKKLRPLNPNSLTWALLVEDLSWYLELPTTGFAFDVHAQMWRSSTLCETTAESCERAGLKVHKQFNSLYYGTLQSIKDPRTDELRATFLETMSASRLVLVPCSCRGVVRYRFYEALSMGRVPVLFCDDCILPLADRIDWMRCAIKLPEAMAQECGEWLREFLHYTEDATLQEMGLYGREVWQTYFAPVEWERVWGMLVKEKLNVA